jgi:hypothetical protein
LRATRHILGFIFIILAAVVFYTILWGLLRLYISFIQVFVFEVILHRLARVKPSSGPTSSGFYIPGVTPDDGVTERRNMSGLKIDLFY